LARILITGVAGFIGSHTAEKFIQEGHSVLGIDNFDPFYPRHVKEDNLHFLRTQPEFEFREFDFTKDDFGVLGNQSFDAVVHLGAKAGVLPSLKDPQEYIRVNIHGTWRILEFMKQSGCSKLVFASSSSIYGNNPVPFEETADVSQPISPYAFSKKSCELLTYTYHSLYRQDVLNLRFFTVFGERQRPDLAIHKFVKAMLKGETISLYGDGGTSRDYTYVLDTVDGIYRAWQFLNSGQGIFENINLGNRNPVSLLEMVKTIEHVLGKKANLSFQSAQPGDVERTFANIEKAERLLGYSPKTTFEEGVHRFSVWFQSKYG
jgi:UDP-glucuronate 4-epimerase